MNRRTFLKLCSMTAGGGVLGVGEAVAASDVPFGETQGWRNLERALMPYMYPCKIKLLKEAMELRYGELET